MSQVTLFFNSMKFHEYCCTMFQVLLTIHCMEQSMQAFLGHIKRGRGAEFLSGEATTIENMGRGSKGYDISKI